MAWAEWASFGLSDTLFWESTAQEITAVLEKARERVGRLDDLAYMISATIVNMAGRAARRPAKRSDFFRDVSAGPPRLSEEAQKRFERRPLMRRTRSRVSRRLST